MKLNNFLKRLIANKCSTEPIEGKNLTGIGVKIINNVTGARYYLHIIPGRDISETTIIDACTKLGIDPTIFK